MTEPTDKHHDLHRRSKTMLRILGRAKSVDLSEVECRPVIRASELAAASRLVYQEYLKNRYLVPNPAKMKLVMQQGTSKSTTFVLVWRKKRVIATLTLVEDSPLGLPMEHAFSNEIESLRKGEGNLAEATMLAVDNQFLSQIDPAVQPAVRMKLLFLMFANFLNHARARQTISTLVACFHPRHDPFYELISFEKLASVRSYSSVQGSPAVARYLEIARVIQNPPLLYERLMDVNAPLDRYLFADCQFRFTVEEYFSFIKIVSGLWSTPAPDQRETPAA